MYVAGYHNIFGFLMETGDEGIIRLAVHSDLPGTLQIYGCFFCFPLFRAAPVAYGCSWARGQIIAVAEAYATAMPNLIWIHNPCHNLHGNTQLLTPPSEVGIELTSS